MEQISASPWYPVPAPCSFPSRTLGLAESCSPTSALLSYLSKCISPLLFSPLRGFVFQPQTIQALRLAWRHLLRKQADFLCRRAAIACLPFNEFVPDRHQEMPAPSPWPHSKKSRADADAEAWCQETSEPSPNPGAGCCCPANSLAGNWS